MVAYANELIKLRKQVERIIKKKMGGREKHNQTKLFSFLFEKKKLERRKKSILNHSFFMK